MATEKPDRTKRPKETPEKPMHVELPPLRTDEIPARAGERSEETIASSLNAEVIPDEIPARAGERIVKEGE